MKKTASILVKMVITKYIMGKLKIKVVLRKTVL